MSETCWKQQKTKGKTPTKTPAVSKNSVPAASIYITRKTLDNTVCTWLMASCFRFWFLVILRSPLLTRSRPTAECSPLWYVSTQHFSNDSNRLNGTHSSSLRLPTHVSSKLYTVSQKNCANMFLSKLHQIFINFDNFWPERWQTGQNYVRCTHCPPHLICQLAYYCN